jgi:hypothetical protein
LKEFIFTFGNIDSNYYLNKQLWFIDVEIETITPTIKFATIPITHHYYKSGV